MDRKRFQKITHRRILYFVIPVLGITSIIVFLFINNYFRTRPKPPPQMEGSDKSSSLKETDIYPSHLEEKKIPLGNGIELELIYLKGGDFQMGSPDTEEGRDSDEGPRHRVELDGFWIGKYPVTQEQYEAVMDKTPSYFKGAKNPVENVSWQDAVEFCSRVNENSGVNIRLPTEAEWEYACRAGTQTRYYFGDSDSDLKNYGWFYLNPVGKTHPVGKLKPNAWGLYDMHGNVWEWCWDWYSNDYYKDSPSRNPKNTKEASIRVLRGGSWYDVARYCRSAYRFLIGPGRRGINLGFRVAAGQ